MNHRRQLSLHAHDVVDEAFMLKLQDTLYGLAASACSTKGIQVRSARISVCFCPVSRVVVAVVASKRIRIKFPTGIVSLDFFS